MKIAILQPERNYSYTGAQRVLDGIIPLLCRKHTVAFFGFSGQLKSKLDLSKLERFEEHQTDWREVHPVLERFSLLSQGKSLRKLVKDVNRWEPDVVMLNNRADLAAWISSKLSAPTVFYGHDIIYNLRLLTEANQKSLGNLRFCYGHFREYDVYCKRLHYFLMLPLFRYIAVAHCLKKAIILTAP